MFFIKYFLNLSLLYRRCFQLIKLFLSYLFYCLLLNSPVLPSLVHLLLLISSYIHNCYGLRLLKCIQWFLILRLMLIIGFIFRSSLWHRMRIYLPIPAHICFWLRHWVLRKSKLVILFSWDRIVNFQNCWTLFEIEQDEWPKYIKEQECHSIDL